MNNPLYWSTWSRASTTNPDSLTVWHNDMLFDFKTGVRQRCMMSEVLFNLAIDLVNRKKDNKRFSMRDLRAFSHLANNLALNCLTHTCTSNSPRQDQQTETYWQQVGLQISTKKTETIVNMDMPAPIKANLEKLRQADYLPGQHHQTRRCTKEDIHSRLGKARSVFWEVNNIWSSAQVQHQHQAEAVPSSVVSTLLYGNECWRMMETNLTSF